MNAMTLQYLVVALLVGTCVFFVARGAWRSIRAMNAAKGSACGGCSACGSCPPPRE